LFYPKVSYTIRMVLKMDKQRSLCGRPLTHPDVAHLEAIIENNKRECASIDAFNKPFAYKHMRVRNNIQTLHDLAQSNPIIRKMLKEFQK
jgi:hypothetical protein